MAMPTKANLKLLLSLLLAAMLAAPLAAVLPAQATETQVLYLKRTRVTVYAPAVGQLENGSYVGSLSSVEITVQSNGSGLVFVDTMPLTEIDMQGSARLAVSVACSITGMNPSDYDFYFVVRSESQVIGGPSAGGVMCTGVVAALEGWNVSGDTMMTGMINPDGSIGPVGGIPYKAQAVAEAGAARFLIPYGQSIITETRTVTVNQGGWIVQRTEPYEINVTDYAMKRWGLEVIEIKDVREAVRYMTGYELNATPAQSPVPGEKYNATMMGLAESLMERANLTLASAGAAFANYSDTLAPSQYKDEVGSYYGKARDAVARAANSYTAGKYYTTSSNCFQASWYSRYVLYASEFSNNIGISYIGGRINGSSDSVESAMERVSSAGKNITSITQLEAFGGAQQRIFEANETLQRARQILSAPSPYYGDGLDSLMESAYALERAKSALWWADIGERFAGNRTINETVLRSVAEQYMQSSSEIVAYAGALGIDTADAQAVVQKAESALDNGMVLLSMFYAIEAYVNATNSVELFGYQSIPEWKVEKARDAAGASIAESRSLGAEPVLAIGYYEFAESLDKPEDRILYYKYASMIAGLSGFVLNARAEPAGWRPAEAGSEGEGSGWNDAAQGEPPAYRAAIYALIIFASGAGLGFAAGALFLERGANRGRRGERRSRAKARHKGAGTSRKYGPPPKRRKQRMRLTKHSKSRI